MSGGKSQAVKRPKVEAEKNNALTKPWSDWWKSLRAQEASSGSRRPAPQRNSVAVKIDDGWFRPEVSEDLRDLQKTAVTFYHRGRGHITASRNGEKGGWSGHGRMSLRLPEWPAAALPVILRVEEDAVTGHVSAGAIQSLNSSLLAPGTMFQALTKRQLPFGVAVDSGELINHFSKGMLKLGREDVQITLGAWGEGRIKIAANIQDGVQWDVDGFVNISIHDYGQVTVELSTTNDGRFEGTGALEVSSRDGKATGDLHVTVADGEVGGQASFRYQGERIDGLILVQLISRQKARELLSASINASPASAPAADGDELVVVGFGRLDYEVTPWLKARVGAMIDADRELTLDADVTVDSIPKVEEQRVGWDKSVDFTLAQIGLPLIGNVQIFGRFGLEAGAWLGPLTLGELKLSGIVSTRSDVPTSFGLSGTLKLKLGAELGINGGVGAKGVLLFQEGRVGLEVKAVGALDAEAEIRLAGDVVHSGTSTAVLLKGVALASVWPRFSLEGVFFTELDTWFGKKEWKWPLGELSYVPEAPFSIKQEVSYALGSGEKLSKPQGIDIESAKREGHRLLRQLLNKKAPKAGKQEPPEQQWLSDDDGRQLKPAVPAQAPASVPASRLVQLSSDIHYARRGKDDFVGQSIRGVPTHLQLVGHLQDIVRVVNAKGSSADPFKEPTLKDTIIPEGWLQGLKHERVNSSKICRPERVYAKTSIRRSEGRVNRIWEQGIGYLGRLEAWLLKPAKQPGDFDHQGGHLVGQSLLGAFDDPSPTWNLAPQEAALNTKVYNWDFEHYLRKALDRQSTPTVVTLELDVSVQRRQGTYDVSATRIVEMLSDHYPRAAELRALVDNHDLVPYIYSFDTFIPSQWTAEAEAAEEFHVRGMRQEEAARYKAKTSGTNADGTVQDPLKGEQYVKSFTFSAQQPWK